MTDPGLDRVEQTLNARVTPGVSVVTLMKKLPLCALAFSALFAIAGTVALAKVAPRPEPFPLFFPLMWDLVMVALGLGIILRRDCARRAGVAWGIFCILASIAIGITALGWLWPQGAEPMGTHRLIFMVLAVVFGLVFGVWQLVTFNSAELKAWTHHTDGADHHHGGDASHASAHSGRF